MHASSDVSECYDESLGDFNDESVDVTLSDVAAVPIINDVLNDHKYNVQGLLSKATDLRVWLEACVGSTSVFCFTET